MHILRNTIANHFLPYQPQFPSQFERNREISVNAAWNFHSVTTFLFASLNFETVLTDVSLQKRALNITNLRHKLDY